MVYYLFVSTFATPLPKLMVVSINCWLFIFFSLWKEWVTAKWIEYMKASLENIKNPLEIVQSKLYL